MLQDGVDQPEPLYLNLRTKIDFGTRYNKLAVAASEGKGISALPFWEDSEIDEEIPEGLLVETEQGDMEHNLQDEGNKFDSLDNVPKTEQQDSEIHETNEASATEINSVGPTEDNTEDHVRTADDTLDVSKPLEGTAGEGSDSSSHTLTGQEDEDFQHADPDAPNPAEDHPKIFPSEETLGTESEGFPQVSEGNSWEEHAQDGSELPAAPGNDQGLTNKQQEQETPVEVQDEECAPQASTLSEEGENSGSFFARDGSELNSEVNEGDVNSTEPDRPEDGFSEVVLAQPEELTTVVHGDSDAKNASNTPQIALAEDDEFDEINFDNDEEDTLKQPLNAVVNAPYDKLVNGGSDSHDLQGSNADHSAGSYDAQSHEVDVHNDASAGSDHAQPQDNQVQAVTMQLPLEEDGDEITFDDDEDEDLSQTHNVAALADPSDLNSSAKLSQFSGTAHPKDLEEPNAEAYTGADDERSLEPNEAHTNLEDDHAGDPDADDDELEDITYDDEENTVERSGLFGHAAASQVAPSPLEGSNALKRSFSDKEGVEDPDSFTQGAFSYFLHSHSIFRHC